MKYVFYVILILYNGYTLYSDYILYNIKSDKHLLNIYVFLIMFVLKTFIKYFKHINYSSDINV
jgi:hypothetical protein